MNLDLEKAKEIIRKCGTCRLGGKSFCSRGECLAASYFLEGHAAGKKEGEERVKPLIEAHEMISKNTCCHCCGEAKRVSTKALSSYRQSKGE